MFGSNNNISLVLISFLMNFSHFIQPIEVRLSPEIQSNVKLLECDEILYDANDAQTAFESHIIVQDGNASAIVRVSG